MKAPNQKKTVTRFSNKVTFQTQADSPESIPIILSNTVLQRFVYISREQLFLSIKSLQNIPKACLDNSEHKQFDQVKLVSTNLDALLVCSLKVYNNPELRNKMSHPILVLHLHVLGIRCLL